MMLSTISLRPIAYLAVGTLMLSLAHSANAQGCRGGGGGGGGGMGYSRGGGGMFGGGYGGMTGGYTPSSYSGGMMGSTPGGSAMSGTTQSSAYQNLNGNVSPYYRVPQQTVVSSRKSGLNNPATVLAHADDLKLTSKQVQLLEKMQTSGKQRAMLVLTTAQRKQLVQIVGLIKTSGSA
jgi:hypothetical protein